MGRRYNVSGNCAQASSATLPLGNIVTATTVRPMLYDLTMASDATPADNTCKFAWQRGTTTGTWAGAGGAAITPQAIDPANPAALATANQGICSAGPTLTASAYMLQWAQNQRATFRWVAAPGSEIVLPATANNSLNLMCLVSTASVNWAWTWLYEE